MVKIRLRRTGAKKQPHYRVVVTDSKAPRDGKFIEIIGHYNPRTEPPTVEIDAERAIHWLSVGAQPSAAVQRMLDKMGIMAQAAAVRKGEISVEELAAQFRAQAQKEAAMEEPETSLPISQEEEFEDVDEEEDDLEEEGEDELEEEGELYDEEEEEWDEEDDDFDEDEYDVDDDQDLDEDDLDEDEE
jgi:small subunit ribosomal protein S16